MGLFNFIFKSMGFKDEKQEKKETKQVTSIVPETPKQEKYAHFDNGLAKSFSVTNMDTTNSAIPTFTGAGGNVVIYAPRENKDIKILVECLRKKEPCIVDLGKLQPADAEKILDFLSGAVYALKGSIKRLQGDLFVLTPEGINIMTQNENQNKNN